MIGQRRNDARERETYIHRNVQKEVFKLLLILSHGHMIYTYFRKTKI